MPSPSEWVQFYQDNIDGQAVSSFGFSDSTIDTTNATSNSMLSQTSSCTTSDHLAPKGCVSKPVRRQSRTSKRTPIILLNANTSNFRALVQQFTGCPSSSISFGTSKGPINLNFELGKEHINHHNKTSIMASFGNKYYYQQSQLQQQEHHHQQHQVLHQEQHDRFSYDNGASNGFLSTYSSPSTADMEILDEFVMDDIFFHELVQ